MQKNKIIIDNLILKIKKGEEISPFLFLSENKDLLYSRIKEISFELFNYFNIPKNYLFTLEDNSEKIKISQVKEFFMPLNLSTPYKIQIFFIENISRMTL